VDGIIARQNALLMQFVDQDYAGAAASVLDKVTQTAATVAAVIQNRTVFLNIGANPILRMVNAYESLQTACADAVAAFNTDSSTDDVLAFDDALLILQYETWVRETLADLRLLITLCFRIAQDLRRLAAPKALALYRPHAGESLYGISTRFYGTPFNWQLIATRNNLTDFTLTGFELLVIPDAT
jgi:hypothetical protein